MSNKRPVVAFLAHSLIGDYQLKQWQALHRRATERDATVHLISPFIFYAQKRDRAEAFRTFELATPLNVDGVVVSGASFEHFFSHEQIRSFYGKFNERPLCNVAIDVPGFPSVVVDNRSGFYRLVSHMIEVHGYRRLAFVQGTKGNADAQVRFEAFRDCLQDHNLVVDERWVAQGDFGMVSGQNAVEQFLNSEGPRPQVILCANDEMALGAMAALSARGVRIPEDIALAGFDDMEAGEFSSPPLTTVSQGVGTQIERALDLVLDSLETGSTAPGVVLSAELVIRRSCGCQPGATAEALGPGANHSQVLFQAYEAVAAKGHSLGQIANFTKSTLEALSLDALCDQLKLLCEGLHLPTLVVVLYQNGEPQSPPADKIPAEARMLFCLIDGKLRTDSESFSPQNWFPGSAEFLKRRRTTIVSEFLFQDEHYGYFMAETSTPDPVLFHLIRSEVSNCLRNIHMKNRMDEAMQKLKELDTLKNQFIANITHDFRSPLTVTLGTSELGLMDAPEGSEDQQRYQVIRDASLKLKNSVDRFLDLTRMDNRGLSIHAAPIELRPFLREIAEFYASSVLNSGIQVRTKLPEHEITSFFSDRHRLEEILNNLLSNAVKYVPARTGIITIAASESETEVCISVTDNGEGIPTNKLEVVFERFTQLASSGNARTKGTGIGLAFSRQLAGYLHGSLVAHSEGAGTGATFTLTLPKDQGAFTAEELVRDTFQEEDGLNLRDENRETFLRNFQEGLPQNSLVEGPAAEEAEAWDSEPDPKRGLILIVEDNHNILELERDCLAAAGYRRFVLADDGKKGLEAAYLHHPDLIICDINMPEMRGDELHQRLMQDPAFHHTPFLFVSAVSEREFILDLRRKGAGAFLTKPIDTQEFVLTVEMHLRGVFERRKALRSSRTDPLTGLASRRPLFEEIHRQFSNRRYRELSFVFLDIDHFKSVNDTYGHSAGDQVLSAVGACLRQNLRPYDVAGRYGGEEFLLLLPDTGLEAALMLAEKLRSKVALLSFVFNGLPVPIRASFGVSSLKPLAKEWGSRADAPHLPSLFEPEAGTVLDWPARNVEIQNVIDALIEKADQALYQAKSHGRNRVEHLHHLDPV